MPRARTIAAALLLCLAAPVAASADRLVVPTGGPPAGFKTVQPDTKSSFGNELVVFDGFLYFAANDNVNGNELWRTDGTNGGTTLVADLFPGAAANNGDPHRLTVVGNRLFFNARPANDQSSETVFYIDASDPTTAKTAKALTAPNNGNPGTVVTAAGPVFEKVNGKALISRLQGENANANYALYVLGDTGDTFTKISSGLETIDAGNTFSPAATAGGWAYFTRVNVNVSPGQGGEPYRTDGSTVEPVKDIVPGDGGSGPAAFVATSHHVYFTANDGTHGTELWVTNPDDKNDTHIVHEHHADATGTSINDPGQVANGDVLYYVPADDPVTGPEVWRTDGTEGGTRVVKDITPGTGGVSVPIPFAFKTGIGLLRGSDIFASDGSEAGTLGPLHTADGDGIGPNTPVVLGEKAYFVAGASPFGQALWRTDGSAQGTFPLSAAGFDGTSATGGCPCAQTLAVLGTKLLFFARDPSTNTTGYVKLYVLDTAQPDELRTATTPPVITTAEGATRLDVTQGTWSGRPTTYAYQWLRNGQPIPGEIAQRAYYYLTAADAGQTISARVTTTGIGAPREASAESAAYTPGGAPAGTPTPTPGPGTSPTPAPSTTPSLTVRKKAKLKGKPKVGAKLRITLPKLAQPGVRVKVVWARNGKRIKGQTTSSLKLRKADKGKRISATITITKAGFKTLKLKVGPTGKVK